PHFEIIASVIGAAAELDRKETGYRTKRGLEGLARAGRPAGGRSYGYKPAVDAAGNKTREIVEAEARIIREIFTWRAEGWSCVRIARELNGRGTAPPGATWRRSDRGVNRKNPSIGWTTSAIAGDPRKGTGVLNNALYIGRQIWGRSKWTPSAKDSNIRKVEWVSDPAQWVVRELPEFRIVDEALWVK